MKHLSFICLLSAVLLYASCSFNTPTVVLVKKQRIYSYNQQGALTERLAVFMLLEDEDGTRVEGIYFGDGEEFFKELNGKNEIDIIYYPDINEYGGRESLQIVISNYR